MQPPPPAGDRIELRIPVILMVLAATAIPIEWRSPGYHTASVQSFELAPFLSDLLANILGYVPVGIVLGGLRPRRALGIAAAMTMFAESLQLVMAHRDPSIVDVAANFAGAAAGLAIVWQWGVRVPEIAMSRGRSALAIVAAALIGAGVWTMSGNPISDRGVSAPGRLEAYWKFDESAGAIADDSSGHGLTGLFVREPDRVDGIAGTAVLFDGAKDNVGFGHPTALRLGGSMTVSAWIKPTSFPVDDAAIVSSHSNGGTVAGYQLDTTVDRGPRTIGFKIGDECGRLAARYGATPLQAGTWYHVAGVYDADARTLDVYLNGKPDDGFLLGSVPGSQHSSRGDVYVGRRSQSEGFEFAGAIDDVRIYSRALKTQEIVSDTKGGVAEPPPPEETADAVKHPAGGTDRFHSPCAVFSDRDDKDIPIAASAVGMLAAFACAGLSPVGGGALCPFVSLAAGASLLPLASSTLPPLNFVLVPLTSLAAGAALLVSIRRRNRRK